MNLHRRCVVCTRPLADHKATILEELGIRMHRFDPGERRQRERRGKAA